MAIYTRQQSSTSNLSIHDLPVTLLNHEVKSMLTGIYAYLELLQKRLEKNEREKSIFYLQKLRQQTDTFSSFLIDLCDLAKMHSRDFALQTEYFSFSEVFVSQKERAQKITRKTFVITGNIPNSVSGDSNLMSRAIFHFLTISAINTNGDKPPEFFIRANENQIVIEAKNISSSLDIKENSFGITKQPISQLDGRLQNDIALFVTHTIASLHGGSLKSHNGKLIFVVKTNTKKLKANRPLS